MRLHIPKPLHGWREFAGEVGIIVIGVLIALVAQQAVVAWQWRIDAAQAETAIRAELARNAGVYDERSLIQPCVEQRLEELTALLKTARLDRKLPDIETIPGIPFRPTVRAAWDRASSSGALEHIDDTVRSSFEMLYALTAKYEDNVTAEALMWSNLRELEHAPGLTSDAILGDATATVSKLLFQSSLNGLTSKQAAAEVRRDKIRPSYYIVLDHEGSRAEFVTALTKRKMCKPLVVDGKPFVIIDK